MPIFKNNNTLKVFKGDYRPSNIYKGGQKIAGWKYYQKEGDSVSIDGTYNDSANIIINGKTIEIGTGGIGPENPYVLQSAENFALVSTNGKELTQTISFSTAIHSLKEEISDCIQIDVELSIAKLVQRTKKDTMPPTTFWRSYGIAEDYVGFQAEVFSDMLQLETGHNNLMDRTVRCNRFIHNAYGVYEKNRNAIWFNQNGRVYISIHKNILNIKDEDSEIEKSDKFNSWLSDNPTEAIYPIRNPIETILSSIKVNTYYPNTFIYTQGEIKPKFIVKVKAEE